MNEIVIVPYVSVHGLKFGQTPLMIEKKLGKPFSSTVDNIMDNLKETREAMEFIYKKDRGAYKLESVFCLKDTNPVVGGVTIFEAGLDGVKRMDSDFVEGPRYTTFRNLGISLGGFGKKKISEKRVLVAFRKESLGMYEIFAEV